MGFTPLDGMMMVTRAGSLDPGILLYLMRTDHADAGRLDDLLNHECGFVGLAGTSDVAAVVRSAAAGDARTRLALGVFTQHLAATIAGMLPALGSLDALVFTAGIGEHAESIRADVCARLAFVNIPRVLVIPANEEWYIARECARVLVPGGESAASSVTFASRVKRAGGISLCRFLQTFRSALEKWDWTA